MALRWVATGIDEDGNEEGYNIDDGTGYVWDSGGNLLDQTTANPISAGSYTPEYLRQNYPGLVAEDPSIVSTIGNFLKSAGTAAFDKIKSAYTKNGEIDWRAIAATAGGLYGLYQSNQPQQPTGYQGKIPKLEAVREQVANTNDTTRRPGSGNQTYFTNTKYVAPADAATARTAAKTEAAGLETLNRANPARETTPLQAGAVRSDTQTTAAAAAPASDVVKKLPVPTYAAGGIANMAQGRYLGGATDGMADKIPARIGKDQEARLSHGEFVVPADVVGHLGNGNSEAGAKRLYEMMDRIRQARTGTTKQGKQINPNKFLPS
jgi:hypothetical protein